MVTAHQRAEPLWFSFCGAVGHCGTQAVVAQSQQKVGHHMAHRLLSSKHNAADSEADSLKKYTKELTEQSRTVQLCTTVNIQKMCIEVLGVSES